MTTTVTTAITPLSLQVRVCESPLPVPMPFLTPLSLVAGLKNRIIHRDEEAFLRSLPSKEFSVVKFRVYHYLTTRFGEIVTVLRDPKFGKTNKKNAKREIPEFFDYFKLLNWSFQGCKMGFRVEGAEGEGEAVERNFERDLFIARMGGIHREFLTMLWEVDDQCR